MRVLIPAAGIGKRLWPHTFEEPKVMLRLAGKPMIGHIVDLVQNIQPIEVVIVVGYKNESVIAYLSKNYPSVNFRFVIQEDMLGLGHAVYITGESDEDTLIILGDTIFRFDLLKILKSEDNSIGVAKVEDPRRFGVVELNEDGSVSHLVEKPEDPPSNLAIVGIYRIHEFRALYRALDKIVETGKKTSGEIQLTDALQEMITAGRRINTFEIEKWLDCGKPETLLSTQRELLGEKKGVYSVPGSVIKDPVFISSGAVIENSVIGPNVDIAENCVLSNCIIRNSIIGENSSVRN
ncbi:NTP transferase domain-containing protein, partial [candidate division WOR-3 bacterium]|nr:NTP transferase domain-containing protein [candidate division WOR-3 bacterium]